MTSRQTTKNPIVRRFRAVAAGKEDGLLVAEGTRLVGEVLSSNHEVAAFAWSPRLLERPGGEDLLAQLRETGAEVYECNDRLLDQLSHLTTHQGVSVLLRRPVWSDADLLGADPGQALVIVAAGLRDPGNLGAVMRAAEAAAATGLITTEGSADPYRDKAVRGSAGSVFRLPCRAGMSERALLEWAGDHGLQVVVAEGGSEKKSWDADLRPPTLLVLGAEGAGVPESLRAAAAARVRIPIADTVESLNVAVAAGVLLFEARRQREAAS